MKEWHCDQAWHIHIPATQKKKNEALLDVVVPIDGGRQGLGQLVQYIRLSSQAQRIPASQSTQLWQIRYDDILCVGITVAITAVFLQQP